jgi:hypothetical protein
MRCFQRIVGVIVLVIVVQGARASDRDDILAIIEAVDLGWENADGMPFKEHFLDYDGARYIESGGQNVGLDDLIDNHVEPEGHALSLQLQFTKPQIAIESDVAWAIVDTEVLAVVLKDGREIHNRGYQTFIFRRVEGHWKVIHTHSSSRPVSKSGSD